MLWGIKDGDHDIVGTKFDPARKKKGNEDLEPWLNRTLVPQPHLEFFKAELEGVRVVVLRIAAAHQSPVKFKKMAYIRVGSYLKELPDFPNHERRLWAALDVNTFESRPALSGLTPEDIVQLIDYPSYFKLHKLPLPENRSMILEMLEADGLLEYGVENGWTITNVGALLYAQNLHDFPSLERKAPRVVLYEGTDRLHAKKEQIGKFGYAGAFERMIGYISETLPNNEIIQDTGLRMDNLMIPRLVIRELIANALIHQDLTISGAGPLIEIFDDRIEITNPGEPLINPLRFIDSPPRSRNERLGAAMRRVGVAEERGTGWDKITAQIELHQLPPAKIETDNGQTRVKIYGTKPWADMDKDDRNRAVYQHACLRYVSDQPMNNSSVRERFGIAEKNKAKASRILRDAQEAELIVLHDPEAGPRARRYVPFWADPSRN